MYKGDLPRSGHRRRAKVDVAHAITSSQWVADKNDLQNANELTLVASLLYSRTKSPRSWSSWASEQPPTSPLDNVHVALLLSARLYATGSGK